VISKNLKADLLLMAVTLIAAAGWIISKEALNGLEPMFFIGSRFLLAGFILAFFCCSGLKKLGLSGLLRTSLVGIVFSLAMVLWVTGLAHTQHIGVGAFLTSLGVVLVPVVAIFFGERPRREVWMSMGVVIAGLACLSLDSSVSMGLAELAFLGSAIVLAIYINLNTRAAKKTSTTVLACVQLSIVGVVGLIASSGIETWQFNQPLSIWSWFLASVLLGTSLRFFLQTWAQGLVTATSAAVILTLEPIWAALFALWWFDATMSLLQVLGCSLIFSALLLSRYKAVYTKFKNIWRQKAGY
jgi:drug/metabolite transporter (DMT)-like permease